MNYMNLYIGCSVLLITILACSISKIRVFDKIGTGDGDNKSLRRLIRAHMNAIEHCLPFGFLVFALSGGMVSQQALAILVIGFLVFRVVHAFSMVFLKLNSGAQ